MATTMMAVVKPEAAAGAEIREVKIPAFGRTDVLVKVKVASICGTDLHIYNWDHWAQNRIHPPLIPGHEFCGEVAAFGDDLRVVIIVRDIFAVASSYQIRRDDMTDTIWSDGPREAFTRPTGSPSRPVRVCGRPRRTPARCPLSRRW